MKRLAAISAAFLILISAFGAILFAKYRLDLLTPSDLVVKQPEQKRVFERAAVAEACSKLQFEFESATKSTSKPIKSTLPLSSDEVAIYRAVLQRWTADNKASLNVSNTTFPFSLDGVSCDCLQGFEINTLLTASRSFHDLAPGALLQNLKLVDRKQQLAVVRKNDPDKTIGKIPVKESVRNAFANGLFSMSEVVFDAQRLHAIVSYGFRCGLLCGNGATVVLEKVNVQWKVMDRSCGGWIS